MGKILDDFYEVFAEGKEFEELGVKKRRKTSSICCSLLLGFVFSVQSRVISHSTK